MMVVEVLMLLLRVANVFSCLLSISISCLSMSILMLNLKSLKRACGQATARSWCLYWCQGRVWSWCWCWCRYWVLVKTLKRMFCEDFETNFCLNLRSWFGQLWHSLGLFLPLAIFLFLEEDEQVCVICSDLKMKNKFNLNSEHLSDANRVRDQVCWRHQNFFYQI